MINSLKIIGRFFVDVVVIVAFLITFIAGLVIGFISGCGIGKELSASNEKRTVHYDDYSKARH